MNILLAYHHTSWRRAGYFHEKYFSALGDNVTPFPIEKSGYWTNFYNLLPFYFPKGKPISVANLEHLHRKKFDCIIELDGEGQFHLTNPKRVPSVLWSMDTHIPAKRRFQMKFESDFRSIFSAHKNYCSAFKKTCDWLPFACDQDLHKNLHLPKVYEVTFVGNMNPQVYPERTELIKTLGRKYKVGVYSSIYREEMVRALNEAKIVFNKSLNGDLNMRVFETLGCGSFLLTDRISSGLLDLFKNEQHLVAYDGEKNLEEKVAYYLKHDKEREEIAQNGQREVLEKHTYVHRAREILENFKSK